MIVFKILAICLICTIIIELSIALIIGIRDKMDIINLILVNILTNPLVSSISLYINLSYEKNIRIISIIILEVFAFFTEGFIYKRVLEYKKINPYILSLLLNCSSFILGLIINNIIY